MLFRVLIVFILFSFNATANMSKEDIRQVFFDAESGHYKAQNYLGSMYHYGVGVTLDYKKAAEWYQKASDQGYADASVRLGGLYRKGDGVRKNYDKAKKLFEKALKKSPNNVDAQLSIGILYYNGEGVEQDYIKAAEWFQKAAQQGNMKGIGWYKSAVKAQANSKNKSPTTIEEYQKAAEQGDAEAQVELGDIFYSGKGAISIDHVTAVKWYRKAAEQGNANGQVKLAHAYQYGKGTSRIAEEALKLYTKAANQGNPEALLKLGDLYQYGHLGKTKNRSEAIKWYLKASGKGNSQGYYNIGSMYYFGGIETKNHAEAIKWFKKAAKNGNGRAKQKLYEMSDEGKRKIKQISEKTSKKRWIRGLKVMTVLVCILAYIILCGWYGFFRRASVIIAPVTLILFILYYEDWIQNNCTGECNIRIDVFIMYPLLFGVVIVGFLNLVRIEDKG